VHDTARAQQVLDDQQFMAGWADPEQVHVDGEDLVEVLASERQVGQIDMEQGSLTRGEVIGVALGRLLDRGRGPVDSGDLPAGQLLAHE